MRASLEVGGGREGGPHRFPERGPLVRALCDGPNDLYVTDSQRSVHPVQATEGVTEGCPLASRLFHLALRAMDERVSPSFDEVLNVGDREDSRGRVGTIRNPAQPSTIRHHQAPSAAGTIRHHQAAQPSTMRNPAPPCTGGGGRVPAGPPRRDGCLSPQDDRPSRCSDPPLIRPSTTTHSKGIQVSRLILYTPGSVPPR